MDLTDKVALITGGKRIGAVVARELAARGVDVALSLRALAEPKRTGGRDARAARRPPRRRDSGGPRRARARARRSSQRPWPRSAASTS